MKWNRRKRVAMGGASVTGVSEAARRDPEGSTTCSGFAERALATPAVPAWIHWVHDRNPEIARFYFQLHYPLDDGYGDEERILKRAHQAEQAARCVERARRFHTDRPVLSAYFPELPDDEDFHAACDAGREWDGHWYSRDPLQAWPEVHGLR
ncbi:hypothetical protein [Nocardia sp. NPDC059228]|uniref:hypothetical protein n=1 Tax=Nocardia sp. NPDC059228 TaxID=3346777 RepID=UPI003693FB79